MTEDASKRAHRRGESRGKRWAKYLALASDIGGVVMTLRDRPGPLDWGSAAFRVAGLGVKWAAERSLKIAPSAWNYFDDEEVWACVPAEFQKLVIAYTTDLYVAEDWLDTDVKLPYVVFGKIGREEVGWCVDGGTVGCGPYVRTSRLNEIYTSLGDRLWKELGTRHLLYNKTGLISDPHIDKGMTATAQMTALLARVQQFLKAGEPRSYLFEGPPGTGKSVAIRWIISQLNMTSVRIDIGVLARRHEGSAQAVLGIETLLRLLRPRVMILDDIDRIGVTAPLLTFLEMARKTCDVIIASANNLQPISGAAIRPGRFDDIVRIEYLDEAVLRTMLADDLDLVDRMAKLPAAYITEFVRRRRVLGREQALAELPALMARATDCTEAEDD